MRDFMRSPYWILNERNIAVNEPDLHKWGEFMHDFSRRIVARTEIHHCTVSTVFLGIDYNFSEVGDPVLFETMVFQGEKESMNCGEPIFFEGSSDTFWGSNRRYSFMSEAIEGHNEAVASIEKQFGKIEDKVSGLLYGIINAEEWTKDE